MHYEFRCRAVAAALLCTALSAPAASIAGWPKSWVETYERFENFIKIKKAVFPRANIVFSPSGKMVNSIRWDSGQFAGLSILIYKNGVEVTIASLGDERDAMNPNLLRMLPNNQLYTAVAKAAGPFGYQYFYPFTWFVTEGKSESRGGFRTVRMISAPEPKDDYWPNERLYRFIDFHAFPDHLQLALNEANRLVNPAVCLQVNNKGIITRNALPLALEQLLVWRIYRNNRLVEKGSAKDKLKYEAARLPGEYNVFVGVEGPFGFMPVSNRLNYPLFRDGPNAMAVMPQSTKIPGHPDFVFSILEQDQLNLLRAEKKNGEYYSQSVHYYGFDARTLEDRFVLELWACWSYYLNRNHPKIIDDSPLPPIIPH